MQYSKPQFPEYLYALTPFRGSLTIVRSLPEPNILRSEKNLLLGTITYPALENVQKKSITLFQQLLFL